jgi:hypothetical protein
MVTRFTAPLVDHETDYLGPYVVEMWGIAANSQGALRRNAPGVVDVHL